MLTGAIIKGASTAGMTARGFYSNPYPALQPIAGKAAD